MRYSVRLILALIICLIFSSVGNLIIKKANISHLVETKKLVALVEEKVDADIVLIGSSRMYNTVNPMVLEDSLKQKVYNLGMQGANIFEDLTLLRIYLQYNPKPKLIVASLDLFTLNGAQALAFTPSYLYIMDNKYVRKALIQQGIHVSLHSFYKGLLSIELDDYYRGAVLKWLLYKSDIPDGDFYYNGYLSNTDDTIGSAPVHERTTYEISERAIDSLQSLISICKANKIQLLLTYAPEYRNQNLVMANNGDSIMNLYARMATLNDLYWIKNNELIMCKDPKNFANVGHVNRVGADIYSAILSTQIKQKFPAFLQK